MKDTPFTADRLLALYDQVAEAEDAIRRLRRFVLDLAVRGKLVEQDPSDEPAAELLKRIATEKARLAKAKAIRSPKPQEAIEATELPCALPHANWAWARLNDIGRLSGGMTPSMNRADYWGGEVIWLSPKDIKSDEVSTSELKITELGLAETRLEAYPVGCLFIVARSGILKRTLPVAINRQPAASNQDLKVLVPYLNGMERYLQIMLSGFEAFILSDLVKTGTTVQSLKYDEFACQPFPLPPLAEQQRIVAKVEELMALCDRLEAARAGREAVRDRLTAATWARLTAPETDTLTFPTYARVALQTLPTLTTRPDQIKTLRQTILNLAVRGKLVAQDPADEPAPVFLKRIAKEKERLVKAGEIKREKVLPFLSSDDITFDLPLNWSWVRLGDLSQLVTSGSRDWAQHYAAEGAIFVRMGNLSKDHYRLRLEHIQRVNAPSDGEGTRTRLEAGDILISITGDVGMLGLIPEGFGEAYINQHTAMVRPMKEMRGRYLAELFRSPFAQGQFNEPQRGIKNSFRLTDVTQFVVPLPPLAEQHRIVAKVDALMALCDQLEASLTTATTTRSRLLEALLHEALDPAGQASEAAQ